MQLSSYHAFSIKDLEFNIVVNDIICLDPQVNQIPAVLLHKFAYESASLIHYQVKSWELISIFLWLPAPQHIQESESETMQFEKGLLAIGVQTAEVLELFFSGTSLGVLGVGLLTVEVEKVDQKIGDVDWGKSDEEVLLALGHHLLEDVWVLFNEVSETMQS